ncbi:MAG: preprotein translocase subunit YajC [Acidobacteriota bacterium]|nr:preprotein translocase subunit YajC [Acidobacteriota bacterium]
MMPTILAFQSAPPGGGGLLPTLGMWALIIAIFYFIVFAPVRKQKKALQELLDKLKKGDKVVTNGGIYGEVAAVEPTTVILKVSDNVKIKISRSAIAGLQGEGDPGSNR